MSLCVWFFLLIGNRVASDIFTSSSHLAKLVNIERELASELKKIIAEKEGRISRMKNFMEKVPEDSVLENPQEYAGNPLNAYAIIKRFAKDWRTIHDEFTIVEYDDEYTDFQVLLAWYEHEIPNDEDMKGAMDAMLRIEETFALSPKIIAGGIQANSTVAKLSPDDLFRIGSHAFELQSNHVALGWLTEANRLSERDGEWKDTHFHSLEYLAWIEYLNENFELALSYTRDLLEINPNDERNLNNAKIFAKIAAGTRRNVTEKFSTATEQKKYTRSYFVPGEDNYESESKRAKALCRGETDPMPKRFMKYLRCWYKTDHPVLILKPAKVERVFVEPELLLYRDAIRDFEINEIKQVSTPLLERATVHNPLTGKIESAYYRTSKSAWLHENDHYLVAQMNVRIEAYTGLNMETAEMLQVANYGIGGHYDTHFDFSRNTPLRPPPWKNRTDLTWRPNSDKNHRFQDDGNRIATMLFYMSDVEKGGATVFTNIGQAITPTKGTAIFWYNLNHDGSGDYLTRHAACPVIIGEKWISNRWIHERGQEFRRPCRLKITDDYVF